MRAARVPIGYVRGEPVYPIRGSEPKSGYHTEGDLPVRVTQTDDGMDLNIVFTEFMATLAIYNAHRSAVARHLSYPTTRPVDFVAQTVEGAQFEEGSEFGEPKGSRTVAEYVKSPSTSGTTTWLAGTRGSSCATRTSGSWRRSTPACWKATTSTSRSGC